MTVNRADLNQKRGTIPTCLSSRDEVEKRYMIMAPLKQPHARNLSREQNLQQYTLVRKIWV